MLLWALVSGLLVKSEDERMDWTADRDGPSGGDPGGQISDALDVAAWGALRSAILAASKGDASASRCSVPEVAR